MQAADWRTIVERMNGYWPGSKPLTPVAVEIWWEELRDRDADRVLEALAALAREEKYRPSLADLVAKVPTTRPEPAAPVTIPAPSRCFTEIGATDTRVTKAPSQAVICRGTVAWEDAGRGWITGRCPECALTYAYPPGARLPAGAAA